MSYTKQTWSDNNAAYPASASRFSHIEDGIATAMDIADTAIAQSIPKQTLVSANYVATISDRVIGVTDTSVARTITLPLASAHNPGRMIVVLDVSGGASGHPITVAAQGTDKINGTTTLSIAVNYGSLILFAQSTGYIATIASTVTPPVSGSSFPTNNIVPTSHTTPSSH